MWSTEIAVNSMSIDCGLPLIVMSPLGVSFFLLKDHCSAWPNGLEHDTRNGLPSSSVCDLDGVSSSPKVRCNVMNRTIGFMLPMKERDC